MKQAHPYTEFSLLTKPNSVGQLPIALRVYDPQSQKRKYYRTGEFCLPDDFQKHQLRLSRIKQQADDILQEMRILKQPFSFDAFERRMFNKGGDTMLYSFLEKQLANEKGQANKAAIRDLLGMLKGLNIKEPHLFEINYNWVKNFYERMRSKRKSPRTKDGMPIAGKVYPFISENTVRFHMRTLRTHYNEAVRRGLAPKTPQGEGPFVGIDTQSTPSAEVKRYLNDEEFKVFATGHYKPQRFDGHKGKKTWEEARTLWLFSYYSYGLNLKDILEVRWDQINGDTFLLKRMKTGEPLTIKISKPLHAILKKYKGQNKQYVFQHLRMEGTEEEKERNHNNILNWLGKNVKRICTQFGIVNPDQVNFYSARHTFAVHYMTKVPNASLFKLMQYMGHKSETSTKNYLQSLIGNSEVKHETFLDEDFSGIVGL